MKNDIKPIAKDDLYNHYLYDYFNNLSNTDFLNECSLSQKDKDIINKLKHAIKECSKQVYQERSDIKKLTAYIEYLHEQNKDLLIKAKKYTLIMKTFIYTEVERKHRHMGGFNCMYKVYRIVNNMPKYLGNVGFCTSSYRGTDHEIVSHIVSIGELPKKYMKGSYINYDLRDKYNLIEI